MAIPPRRTSRSQRQNKLFLSGTHANRVLHFIEHVSASPQPLITPILINRTLTSSDQPFNLLCLSQSPAFMNQKNLMLKLFSHLRGNFRSKRANRNRLRQLLVEQMESRRLLATFAGSAGNQLVLDLGTASSALAISAGTSAYTLSLTGSTWTSGSIAGATVTSANTLSVTKDFFSQLTVSDSANSIAVNFGNSGNTYTDPIVVDLNNTGSVVNFNSSVIMGPNQNLIVLASNGITLSPSVGLQTSGTGFVSLVADNGGTAGTLTVGAGASIYGDSVSLSAANVSIDPTANIGSSSPYSQVMLNNNPIAYYRLNETSGTTANSSGILGGAVYQNGVGLGSQGAISDDSAANFDGVDDFVSVPSNWNSFSQAGTMMAWIKLDSLDNEPIFAKQDSGIATYGVFSVGTATSTTGFPSTATPGRLYFHGSNTSSIFNGTAQSNATLTTGKYYHVAVVYSNTFAQFYVNGVLDSTTFGNFSTIPLAGEFNPLSTIGAWPTYGAYLDGSIDEFAIYPTALASNDIAAKYAGGNPRPNIVTANVSLRSSQSGRGINLGSATGQLDLADAELDRITATNVNIGSSTSGTITVSSPITHANILNLNTGAGISVNDAVTMASGRSFLATSFSTTAGIGLGNANSDISTSGAGSILISASQGISLSSGSSITTQSGSLNLSANQGATPTTGDFIGINVDNALVQSSGGPLTVRGKGGTSGVGQQFGVLVHNGGDIIGSSSLTTVTGVGGNNSSGTNIGVYVLDAGSNITSISGNVLVNGTGGGTGFRNYGTLLEAGGVISSGNAGSVQVTGTGGGSPTLNNGVFVTGAGSQITSGAGIQVTATGQSDSEALRLQSGGAISSTNNAPVTIVADSLVVVGTAAINSGLGTTTVRPRTSSTKIDLGGIDVLAGSQLTLGLSDSELDFINAGFLSIGSTTSGSINVTSDFSRASSTAIRLFSAGDISISGGEINTGGGSLLLDSGLAPAVVKPSKSGTDVRTNTLTFAGDLSIVIDGATVDTLYSQLNVVGSVNLTGVNLKLSGSYTPASTDRFILVDNDGSDLVIGTFNGLSEGTILSVNGTSKRITYVGGTGNDVELVPTNQPPIVATSDVTGAVTELGTPTGNLTDSGSIGFSDVNLTDVHSINSSITASSGALGTLTASVTTDTTGSGTGGVITWNYSVAATAVEYLAAGQTKVETFSITLNDGNGGTVNRLISVTITGTNDAPNVATADATGSVTELGTPTGNLSDSGSIGFLDVDLTDVHSINSSITASSGALGTLTASVTTDTTGSGTGGVITWNYSVAATAVEYLAAGQTKAETFSITLNDGNSGTVDRLISMTVTGTNDGPTVVAPLADVTVDEDAADLTISLAGVFADIDSSLTYSAVSNNGALVTASVVGTNLTLSFVGNANGSTTVTVTASDGSLSASDTFAVVVNPINDGPTVVAPLADVAVDEDAADLTISLAGVFADVDSSLTYSAVSSNGALVTAAVSGTNLTLSFVGNANGSTTVTVTASDGSLSASDTFAVVVNPINDGPTVVAPLADVTVDEDAADLTISLAGVFADIDSSLTYSAVSNNGALVTASVVGTNLTLSFVGNANGSTTVTVTASDGSLSASDTFAVVVNPINDAPTVVSPLADVTVDEDAADLTIPLAGVFADIDSSLTYSAVSSNGALVTTSVSWHQLDTELRWQCQRIDHRDSHCQRWILVGCRYIRGHG